MELTNEFRVSVPIEEAWEVLTDLNRIAPCLPGANLEGTEGEYFLGTVKVKVGPITASYKGKVQFLEKDDESHKAVLRAEGRDTKGQGNANATITATLKGVDGATNVEVVTDLTISGRVAQFGRGVLADVSSKILDQFVLSLEKEVLSGSTRLPIDDGVPGQNGKEQVDGLDQKQGKKKGGALPLEEPESQKSFDALSVVAKPIAKRAAPFFAVLVLLGILLRRRKHRQP